VSGCCCSALAAAALECVKFHAKFSKMRPSMSMSRMETRERNSVGSRSCVRVCVCVRVSVVCVVCICVVCVCVCHVCMHTCE